MRFLRIEEANKIYIGNPSATNIRSIMKTSDSRSKPKQFKISDNSKIPEKKVAIDLFS